MDYTILPMDSIIHPTFNIILPMDDNKHTKGYYNPSIDISILCRDFTILRKDYSKLQMNSIKPRMDNIKRTKDYIIHHFFSIKSSKMSVNGIVG